MAPILSFTAEQLFDHYAHGGSYGSVHMEPFASLDPLRAFYHKKTGDIYFNEKQPYFDENAYKLVQSNSYFVTQRERWNFIKAIRSALLKAIEEKRAVGLIKHPLEVKLTLAFDLDASQHTILSACKEDLQVSGTTLEQFIKELLIVSQVTIHTTVKVIGVSLSSTTMQGLHALVTRADGDKCPRCWQWSVTQQVHHLCDRCAKIVL